MAADFFIKRFLSIDFLIIINDRLVGSIQLFPMIDDKISADSHHYQQLNYSFTSLCISDKLLILVFFPFRENLNVNDALMELFILAYACKTACARRIIGMYMYFCQGSQICQIWRILRQNCSDDSTEVTEGVTSTPKIFGNKQGATFR